MKALVYLLLTTLKNRILSLRKKPAMLILYLICAASLILVVVVSMFNNNENRITGYSDIRMLYSFVVGLGAMFIYSYTVTGLSNGGTLFTMADVGLLFTAPISPRRILLYGLIKQMGTTLLTAIFILYQVGTLNNTFGFNGYMVIGIFIIYAIMIFFCQLLTMGIYLFSNGDNSRKNIIRGIMYGCFAIILAFILFKYIASGNILEAIYSVIDTRAFSFVPIAGWSTMFIKAMVEHDIIYLFLSVALYMIFSILIILLFTSKNADYYEDVLKSTEMNYTRLSAAKEGKKVNAFNKKVKVKEEDSRLSRGKGANAFLYKHLLEMKRSSKFLFVDAFTITGAIGGIILAKSMDKQYASYIVFAGLVYIQFFITVSGKLSQELTKHYIYIIPESSRKKVFYSSLTNLVKPFIDGVIIFTVVCVANQSSLILNLFLALAYASTGTLFVSFTILYQKILGGQPNKLVGITVGMFFFFILVLPGSIAAVVSFILLPSSLQVIASLPYTIFGFGITCLVFYLCGNLLDTSEYSGK